MTNWVRLWEDMPTDPKWRVVARRSGRPLPEVIAVFVFMMTNAGANATERGRLLNWDDEDVAAALDMDGEHVAAIREAMEGKTVEDGRLSGWDRRQPKREDNSAERAKAWREGKKRKQTEDKDSERMRTHANATEPPEKNRIDTDSSSLRSEETRDERAAVAQGAAKAFERFWTIWPNKTGKPAAAKAFLKVWTEADEIIAGIGRYVRDKPADRPWLNPTTFLNQRRWEDAPAPVANARAGPPPEERSGVAKLLAEAYGIDGRDGTQTAGNIADFRAIPVIDGRERIEDHSDGGGVFGRLLIGDG